jgi:hypothetical protein
MRFALLGLLFLTACATQEVTPTGLHLMTESQYEKTIDTYSDGTETYNGLYNAVNVRGTILNSRVALAEVDQDARLYQWDQNKYNEERQKALDKVNKSTEVFISFFTPERKHDDLQKFDSLWKVFLDVNGQRFEGKVTKIKLQTVEVQRLYAYHTRFSTPYLIEFPIAAKKIENLPAKLTITGPAGSAQLKFSALLEE